MSLHRREVERDHGRPNTVAIQNQPTSSNAPTIGEDELAGEADEPPDERHRKFTKAVPPPFLRKESLLTQALHPTTEVSTDDDDHGIRRIPKCGLSVASSASTASTAEATSDGYPTSLETGVTTPNSSLLSTNFGFALSPQKTLTGNPVQLDRNKVDGAAPLTSQPPLEPVTESQLEANLGRKRCITFACGGKSSAKPEGDSAVRAEVAQVVDPSKRPCRLTFACPIRASNQPSMEEKRCKHQPLASPPRLSGNSAPYPAPQPRTHRDSDSTVRNVSPKTVMKSSPVRLRKFSSNSDFGKSEALRFHEFGTDEEEPEDWTQVYTVHRNRLTVADTLQKENDIRRLAEEADEEALEEEETEQASSARDDIDEVEDMDEDEAAFDERQSSEEVSDAGFQTDDEKGFALSDEESEADSDYNWWAPGRSTAATSTDGFDHTLALGQTHPSESSIDSPSSDRRSPRPMPYKKFKVRKRLRQDVYRPSTPDLPDSTDFICGTLDEDRPLEKAYASCIEQRKAAKGKLTAKDIDPSFPASDPEMDEEDEDDYENVAESEEEHILMHGEIDQDDNHTSGQKSAAQAIRLSRHSPQRLRSPPPPQSRGQKHGSPPPLKHAISHRSPPPLHHSTHHSPPPRRLFGRSPSRLRSPRPAPRIHSPLPSAEDSDASPRARPINSGRRELAQRPQHSCTTSLPRVPNPFGNVAPSNNRFAASEDEGTPRQAFSREAIDIVYGLEAKRKGRQEQHYQKHRHVGKEKQKKPQPGKGAQRMREVGLEASAHRGKHMLSV